MMKTNSILFVVLFALCTLATAQLTNYAIDCRQTERVPQGKITIPDFDGITGENTIQIDFYPKSTQAATLAYLYTSNGKEGVKFSVTAKGNLQLENGKGNTAVSTAALPGYGVNKWFKVAAAWKNGEVIFYSEGNTLGNPVALPAPSVAKRKAEICLNLYGLVDNFAIWSYSRSKSEIANFARVIPLNPAEQEKLVMWFPFDEGFGNGATAVVPSNGAWTKATLVSAGFAFTDLAPTMRCYSWGDPHIFVWNWDTVDAGLYGKEWASTNYYVEGTHRYTKCGADFEFRGFMKYMQYWSATVQRIMSMRTYDRFYLVSVGEGSHPRGVWYRDGVEAGWKRLAEGTATDVNGVTTVYKGNDFNVIIPQVGDVAIVFTEHYLNMDVYLDTKRCSKENRIDPKEKANGLGLCDRVRANGDNYGIFNIEFKDFKYGPDVPDPTPPKVEEPCEGALKAEAEAVCKVYSQGKTNTDLYTGCVMDICAAGDPEITIGNPPKRDCLIQDLQNLLEGKLVETTCDNCPNDCSGHGDCKSNKCACHAGWAGLDCGVPVAFDCYSLTLGDGDKRKITPHRLLGAAKPESRAIALKELASRFTVEDSIVIYPVTQKGELVATARSLIVTADSKKSVGDGNSNFKLQLDFDFNVASVQVDGASKSGNTITIERSWSAGKVVEVVLANLPADKDWTVKITVLSSTGIRQVLVGSGTARDDLDVLKVSNADWNNGKLVLAAKACDGQTCAQISDTLNAGVGNCEVCAAAAECGFCLDNGRCLPGDNAGPIYGTCRNWRYSFDNSVSRRVTTDFGWPVTPSKTEVWLAAFDAREPDVPVDIRVNAGDLHTTWDVALAIEAAADDDIINMVQSIETKLLPTLQDVNAFPDVQFGLFSYGNGVTSLKDLAGVSAQNVFQYQRALQTFRGDINQRKNNQLNALKALALTGGAAPNWRKNARRMVILQVSEKYAVDNANHIKSVQSALLDAHIVPVFAVKNKGNLKTDYSTLVHDVRNGLGFGLVLDLDLDSGNLHTVVQKAIRLATGQISLVFTNQGHVDFDSFQANADTLNIVGLSNGLRARYHIPIKRENGQATGIKTAKITAVGFGTAEVVDIASDKPTSTDAWIEGDEDVLLPISDLHGTSFRGLSRVIPRIMTLPDKGQLFQALTSGGIGEPITEVPTLITHPSGLIYFLGGQDEHSLIDAKGNKAVYTTFKFSAYDGCADSNPSTYSIYLNPVNDIPDVSQKLTDQAVLDEDTFVLLDLEIDDVDFNPTKDTVQIIFTSVPQNGKLYYNDKEISLNEACPENPMSEQFLRGVKYVPFEDYNGPDSFTFQGRDSHGALSNPQQLFKLTVLPVNDPPVATAAVPVTGSEDTYIPITLTATDPKDYRDQVRILFNYDGEKGSFWTKDCSTLPEGVCQQEDKLIDGKYIPGGEDRVVAPLYVTIFYLPELNEFSCGTDDRIGDPTCTVYTEFSFQVFDSAGAGSEVLNVPIYVFNLNDPPTCEDVYIRFDEDTEAVITLVGDDIDTPLTELRYQIQTFPPELAYTRLNGDPITKDDSWVGDAGVTQFKVRSTIANDYGDDENEWFYSTFQYHVFDGQMYSDGADVDVQIVAVNDPPVATLTDATANEDELALIELTATDVDTPAEMLSFYITALPPAEEGTLYTYFSNQTTGPELAVGDLIEKSTYKGADIIAIYFLGAEDWYGTTTFGYKVVDKDFFDLSAPGLEDESTVTVVVHPVNDAPLAVMDPVDTNEDTAVVIQLDGTDPWFGEGDPLQAIISTPLYTHRGCDTKRGKLYQYRPEKEFSEYSDEDEITEPETLVVTENKVVYIPVADMNSNEDPDHPHLFVIPAFAYRMRETTSHAPVNNLESADQRVTITINEVNDVPVVYQTKWFGESDFVACSDSGKSCTFDEDLGAHWTKSTGFKGIWFGGDDVEKSPLEILITNLDCPTTAIIETAEDSPRQVPHSVSDSNPFVLPTLLNTVAPPTCTATMPPPRLVQGINFIPGLDEFDNAQGYYCKITYRVRDKQGAVSVDSKTITINVTPRNDLPRIDPIRQSVVLLEDTTKHFQIEGSDPEGDAFALRILSCEADMGILTVEGVTVDCNALPFTSANPDPSKTAFDLTFTPNANENGNPYHTVKFDFLDGITQPTADDRYTLELIVLPGNDAPVVTYEGEVREEHEVISTARVAPIAVVLSDIDVDSALTTRVFTVTVQSDKGKIIVGREEFETEYKKSDALPTLNQLMSTLAIKTFAEEEDLITVTITIDDMGNTGSCEDEDGKFVACSLTSSTVVKIAYTIPQGINDIAVGAGTAAGVAVAAALAGLAYKRFQKRDGDEYQPWDIEDDDVGIVDNPLYQQGISGVNPLYDAGDAINKD